MIDSFGHGVFVAAETGVVMTPMGNAPRAAIPDDLQISTKWVPWGKDNLFPQGVVKAAEPSTIIGPAIAKQIKLSYAGGVRAVKRKIVDDEEKFVPVINKDFDDFYHKSNLSRYLMEAFSDLYWFLNPFPNFILSRDRSKIVQLFEEEACYCRWAKPDEKTGLVKKCFVSANWEKGTPSESEIMEVDVIDPYFDPVSQIREHSAFRYVYPLSFPSPNRHYYQLAPWNAAISSGWLAFSLQIPKFKEAMMRNQISIKYHLEIDEDYWPLQYEGWTDKKPDEQESLKKQFVDKFNKSLADTKNAAKTIMTAFRYDKTGNERNLWKITPIDDKIKSGIYVEDSQEASTHLMNAMELDPSIFGNGPGKNFGSGSGSDKNAAYNLYMASVKPFHDLILAPLYVVRDYNGWDPELEFEFRTTFMSRSTSGKPTMQPAN